ncbi:hypothetical protein SQG_03233 [Enterococcus faecalis EnGen0219]|nr:hypothetical protein S97_03236 [Enterococcus faecalis EnGen0120]EOE56655.1 hypothetical protein S9C_03268 [Enterococcus faecalis EnGen0109]EOE67785.1 hypothetical protein S9K_03249 [Enterococcus faecalis EnGen0085]EOH13042.1 hypothetical protein SQG_03233 [Enterococcus faecalis EnGen0219]EOK60545.1 hypothetical protein QAK_03213 [Enterococcus faecalis EnGen0069]
MKNKTLMLLLLVIIFLYLMEYLSPDLFKIGNTVLFWFAILYFIYMIVSFFYYKKRNK